MFEKGVIRHSKMVPEQEINILRYYFSAHVLLLKEKRKLKLKLKDGKRRLERNWKRKHKQIKKEHGEKN